MYKDKILKLLRLSKVGFISGEELARKCGISRTMVWKHVKSLERDGFGIEAVPSQGYRITSVPDILRLGDVKPGLKTRVIGKEIELLPEVSSTNTLAMERASKGAPEGTVVIAEMQTGGKGRLGRKWISPKGNLYLSLVLRPDIPMYKAPLITLMGAVAVASAIRKQCALETVIKWPNDILISGRKVSGLLTEMSAEQDRIRHIVLGIGDGHIERGHPRPRPEDPVVEEEAIHLGADEIVVDPLSDGPAAGIHGRQTLLINRKLVVLLFHRRGAIVGNAVDDLRLHEFPPFLEKLNKVSIRLGLLGIARR